MTTLVAAPPTRPFSNAEPAVALRQLHLDLKGLPPTPERFLRLLEIAAEARFNQILIEWEDTFPWTVDPRFRGETCYTPADIQAIHETADRLGLELVPLVQCLGHMETPLQLADYAPLREDPHSNMSLNPLAPGAVELILAMVEDVLELMPGLRYLHLGGDESWAFGTHPDTAAYIAQHGKAALYLHFLEPLLDYLEARNIRPILWHDMMREWPIEALSKLGARADIMIWGYFGTPWRTHQKHFTVEVLNHFAAARIPLWGAGSFKCGSLHGNGRSDLPVRTENMLGWVRATAEYSFKGVCATGWSRNTTADVQYAPIDANLDMLVQSGVVLHEGVAADFDDCVALLDHLGEGADFRARADAIKHFDDMCDARWQSIRYLRQFLANFLADPTRRPGSMEQMTLDNLVNKGSDELRQAAEALLPLFAPVVDAVWIERLYKARLIAIDSEIAHLRADWPTG